MSDDSRAVTPAPTAIAIPTPMGQLVPAWWAQAFGPTTMYKTTLQLDSPSQRQILLAALNEDGEPAAASLNCDLEIVGFTVSPASRIVDGELQEWVRCVLHTADGRNVVAGSMGVLKSLMLFQTLIGPAPWTPPLKKRLVSRPLKDGKHWYSLVDSPTVKATGKPGK
jgi:hypothetical protein